MSHVYSPTSSLVDELTKGLGQGVESSLFNIPTHDYFLEVRKTKLNDMFFLIFHLLMQMDFPSG